MATMLTKCQLRALIFFFWATVSAAIGNDLLSCDTLSPDYHCNGNGSPNQCSTFAILRTNSYYSSLSNLSSYLGINRFVLAQANGFSADAEFLPQNQPLLIPIDCKCNGAFFQAVLVKISIRGDSFYSIAESLEGLTTCKAIRVQNPSVSPWDLGDKVQLLIPIKCACPSSSELGQQTKLLISYPVSRGDTISNLALKFNVTPVNILSANNRSGKSFKPERLVPVSTLLIPLKTKPVFGLFVKPQEPNLGFPSTTVPRINPHKRKSKISLLGDSMESKGESEEEYGDSMQDGRFGASTTQPKHTNHSEKKVSFDQGSQDTLDGQIIDATPHKMVLETYTIEELKKATEDFNSNNLIEESVFHGRLKGKNLAIKREKTEIVSKIEFGLFQDATHHHPNIIRLIGTCSTDGPDSFLAFEYAKNGSLKDWLHGGLAMKSQFIASCYCFLNWNQRLKICLDIATALQYMHQIMIPSYVHRNIKSKNVFLDEEFNAKIGNFGMARCVEDGVDDKASCSSDPGSWSKGYLAPECIQQGTTSLSSDVFAYGVVLLEVLSGKTPIIRDDVKGKGSVWLSEKIKLILESENAEELREWMDNTLGDNYSFDAAVTLANLARACVEDDPGLRPSAGEIVEKLSRLVEELPQGEQFSICESSSKPLVKAAIN
ncbi:Protein LYK2 [Camellia lanceoleosa]|uniref:Protein LYK2 n=1 Tax=Camellia lanceoleosa TaxID=1840588 RepID=A0ACC0IVP2_9ERIC|nr:Protein LYK2 [Camellia lanceoleosa]